MSTEDAMVHIGSLEDLDPDDRTVVSVDGRSILVFSLDGGVYAVDNRCPHMGFPLSRGTVDDGILTCHWHHARFDLGCGSTFDPFADDVDSFPVEVRGEQIWVDPSPTGNERPADRWSRRLEDGLEENLRLVIAKSIIGLDDAGVDWVKPLWIIGEFGTSYREAGWRSGLTILSAMANILPALGPEDRRRAIFTGGLRVANECSGEPPRFVQDPFERCDHPVDQLDSWFRDCVEVRDRQGAERVLRTAIRGPHGVESVIAMLVNAATDHRYLNVGHTIDFINKACQFLDHVGWEHADEVLPSLVPGLVAAQRSEERSSWRQPVDLVTLLDTEFDDLPLAIGETKDWAASSAFVETLLDDDPDAIVAILTDAINAGVHPEPLAAAVTRAAAQRIAQFSTANEFNDWNTVHHTYSYANAVHELTRRTQTVSSYKAIFDGAINVYLDRFLNTPPVPIPPHSPSEDDLEGILEQILETFAVEGSVNRAGTLVAQYLDAGGDQPSLKRTLGKGLLREDANFHTMQNLEAAFQQSASAKDPDDARLHLVATARYLSAHFPTRRETEQTFTIASRLHRGEQLYEG